MSASISPNHPLAMLQFVDGYTESYRPAPTVFLMSNYYSMKNSPTKRIEWDVKIPLIGGMTKPTAPGAESPIIKGGGFKRKYVWPVHFREKYRIDGEEFVSMREIGTLNQPADAEARIAEIAQWLRDRVQTRMEWTQFKATLGEVIINENGLNITYPFDIPHYLDQTVAAGFEWDNPVTANPLNDIMDMMDMMTRFNYTWAVAYVNAYTMKVLQQVQQFRDFYTRTLNNWSPQQMPPDWMSTELLNDIIRRFMPVAPTVKEWNGRFELTVPITDLVVLPSNHVVVDEYIYIEQQDEVIIESMDSDDQQLLTVANVNPAIRHVSFTDTLAYAFKPNSVLHISKPYLPNGKMLFLPAIGPGVGNIPELGRQYMTPTIWAPGSPTAPRAGIFRELQEHWDGDPKYADLHMGYEGAAVVRIPEGRGVFTGF